MYIIFFVVGVGFVLLSFFLDAILDINSPLPLLQPKLIAVFLTVLGGMGIILSARFEGVFAGGVILVFSLASGLVVAGLINRLVIIPLHRAQNTSSFDKQAVIGAQARVISIIPQGGYGKIRYTISGSTVTGPAKAEDGGGIKAGADVNIVYTDKGTYFVKEIR